MKHAHLIGDVEKLVASLEKTKSPYILLGDFNLPDIDWSIPACTSNRGKQDQFLAFFTSHSLTQKVLTPTRNQNTLDLVFESEPGLILDVETDAPLSATCDHDIVRFNVAIEST